LREIANKQTGTQIRNGSVLESWQKLGQGRR